MKQSIAFAAATLSVLAALAPLSGCAKRTGRAYLEIENDQSMVGPKAEPIQIAPGVEVVANEYQRSYLNNGSNVRQRIVIRGPVMIVPVGPATTQPAR